MCNSILKLFIMFISPLLMPRFVNGFLNNSCIKTRAVPMRQLSRSPVIMRSKKSDSAYDFTSLSKKNKHISPVYKPKSENQKKYTDFLNNSTIPIVLGIGPAGCGKTLFACLTAIKQLQDGSVDKIILTRPVVPVEEEDIGFLPGNLVKKMDPWTRPIFDILLEYYNQRDLDIMVQAGIIEISPLAFMRGRTFKRAFIIADEMQNSTPNQMLMLTTRIGDGSKMVITGDLKQSDRSMKNGLGDIMDKIREHSLIDPELCIKLVLMNSADIERSPIVAKILDMYSKPNIVYIESKKDNNNVDNTKDNILKFENPLLETVSNNTSNSIRKNYVTNDAALIPAHHISNRI